MTKLLTIKEAGEWASRRLNRPVTSSNIAYLIQYGRIKKRGNGTGVAVAEEDLAAYYNNGFATGRREQEWRKRLGDDLNWRLAFEHVKEKETTKHVHRLHPYKGKFIPQLAEYFLDGNTDESKQRACFAPGDVALDPFCGSGTALAQANELGIHAVGVDISAFNALISNVKVCKPDFADYDAVVARVGADLRRFVAANGVADFERELSDKLSEFNRLYFPSPEFKIKARSKEINEAQYAADKVAAFAPVFERLRKRHGVQTEVGGEGFINQWHLPPVKKEIRFVFERIRQTRNPDTKKILAIALSRVMRTCRATTHADLATLKEPTTAPYYCAKHGKICKPLFSILSWWERYVIDTRARLAEFAKLRTDTRQICLRGDARSIDIVAALQKKDAALAALVKKNKIRGIFSSPPYVGLIDYHEQHAYAYDLFGFERHDDAEIGPLSKGQGRAARESYASGIAAALVNCKAALAPDYDVFLVANDKFNLYPRIAEQAGMRIVDQYKRPVLNRSEKDKSAYAESIFHLKEGA